jgi:hypothetical protein
MRATVIKGTIVHMGQMHACKKTKNLENKIKAAVPVFHIALLAHLPYQSSQIERGDGDE